MNGRLYDPVIGRFFSPDKYVANSSFTQDFNRYTYARNNPLMYTDPDGEFPWLASIIAGFVMNGLSYTASVAASDGGFKNWDWGKFAFAALAGAATGAIGAGVNAVLSSAGVGGFFGGAISGSVTGAANGLMNGINMKWTTGNPKDFRRSFWIGVGTGAMFGGFMSGFDAMRDGKRFLDGAMVSKGDVFSQPIPQINQKPDECLFSSIKAVDQSLGFNHTDAELYNCLVFRENELPSDVDSWVKYGELTGCNVRYDLSPNDALSEFAKGARVAVTLDYGTDSHSVVLTSFQDKTIVRVNGFEFYDPKLRIMDPAGSGWGWNRLNWYNFSRQKGIFVIH
jgi:hypothetical protein